AGEKGGGGSPARRRRRLRLGRDLPPPRRGALGRVAKGSPRRRSPFRARRAEDPADDRVVLRRSPLPERRSRADDELLLRGGARARLSDRGGADPRQRRPDPPPPTE